MDAVKMKQILTVGETIGVEFKKCGDGIEKDTYETNASKLTALVFTSW